MTCPNCGEKVIPTGIIDAGKFDDIVVCLECPWWGYYSEVSSGR